LAERELTIQEMNERNRNPAPRILHSYDKGRHDILIYEHVDNLWMEDQFGDEIHLKM